jgi:hypothetical protein
VQSGTNTSRRSAVQSGDRRADLVALAHGLREVYRRRPWMLDIAPGRVALGPNTVDVLEYALATMQDLDAPTATKMEAFALLNGFVALLVRTEKEQAARRLSDVGAPAGCVIDEWGRCAPRIAAPGPRLPITSAVGRSGGRSEPEFP